MNNKLTIEMFIKKANKIHNNKYDYSIAEYINTEIKIKIICPKHGIFMQRPANHLLGQKCPHCAELNRRNKKRLTSKEFIEKANKIHSCKYDYSLVNYNDSYTKIIIMCSMHDKFEQTPNSHLNGKGCPICGKIQQGLSKRTTNETFIKKANIIHHNKYYYLLIDWINSHEKIKIICPEHGIFEQTPTNHLDNKQGCPICKESKGEKKIAEILNKMNISFIREKTFQNCIGKKRKLPFDFYLPKQNLIIEFDGKHHFEIVDAFGGEKGFNETQENDKIKNNFLIEKNIQLLRIPYNQYENIENVLYKSVG
jgi:very-short-patch-repair endonuclease/phage FluMu protein Com